MNKIFLESLPIKDEYKSKRIIDWENSVGHSIHFIYNNVEGDLEIIKYNKYENHPKLVVKYNNKELEMYTDAIKDCRLKNLLRKDKNTHVIPRNKGFKYEIGTRFQDDKRDITITDREYRTIIRKNGSKEHEKWYKYECNKCGFNGGKHWYIRDKCYRDEYWVRESGLIHKKTGCSCCCSPSQIVVKGINDIATIRPDLIKYFKNIEDAYTHTTLSADMVEMVCPDCMCKKESIIATVSCYGYSCSNCGDGISAPNKIMFSVLTQLDIKFETEKKFKWCVINNYFKNKQQIGKFDFFIPSLNIIIEMDGGLGHGKGNFNYNMTSEESKYIDDEKDRLANKHNIDVIRIDCDYKDIERRLSYIKQNILNNKKLNELFNLSSIDWNIISEYSIKNLTKEVCDYWHFHKELNNEDIGTTHLMTVFNKNSVTTIIKYLKIGTKLGWCNYNPKEEIRIGQSRQKTEYKHIEVFKDKISLGIFKKGIMELDNQSEELFGVKLDYRSISSVCNGNTLQHNGFQFQYVQYDEFGNYIKQELKKVKNPIIIMKDGIQLGEFPSIHDLINKSEELFRVKFNWSTVKKTCIGEKDNYKGYTFKYKFNK